MNAKLAWWVLLLAALAVAEASHVITIGTLYSSFASVALRQALLTGKLPFLPSLVPSMHLRCIGAFFPFSFLRRFFAHSLSPRHCW